MKLNPRTFAPILAVGFVIAFVSAVAIFAQRPSGGDELILIHNETAGAVNVIVDLPGGDTEDIGNLMAGEHRESKLPIRASGGLRVRVRDSSGMLAEHSFGYWPTASRDWIAELWISSGPTLRGVQRK
jgi:hypothetical protein